MSSASALTVSKHGSHDQKTHAGGRGAGGGGGTDSSASVSNLQMAVNRSSSAAIQYGDTKMKDVAYSASKDADVAREKLDKGDFAGAKESMDTASSKIQSLPAMAEEAKLDKGIVSKLTNDAKIARDANKQMNKNDQKLNNLGIEMFNHKQSITPAMRAGKLNTPAAQAHIRRGQEIVTQAQNVLGGSRDAAMDELNRRMGS